ncbi:rhodanese-like domain-containing protein [Bartonella sp. HY406]|uniref:rhodanese-like domain-containing protein n=1 Tax=Bartonella sp. HY406 TaxID=2979331 RepID=UPI0021C9AAB0|nr:rhodanese-like domain-containing protein [Bartonella sp. HY406]UXN02811.1 rhodanese-like domain-containing protein [Bartonella sp. HY406]
MKNIMASLFIFMFGFSVAFAGETTSKLSVSVEQLPPSLVDLDNFLVLAKKVQPHRSTRLLHLDEFLELSRKDNVILLDARSARAFSIAHLKGAINLDFTDFSQAALQRIIPDKNTTILIYCNNNFSGQENNLLLASAFPSKVAINQQAIGSSLPIMLALNLQTYINLYGYGYTNVYELADLVPVTDPRIVFEGEVNSSKE